MKKKYFCLFASAFALIAAVFYLNRTEDENIRDEVIREQTNNQTAQQPFLKLAKDDYIAFQPSPENDNTHPLTVNLCLIPPSADVPVRIVCFNQQGQSNEDLNSIYQTDPLILTFSDIHPSYPYRFTASASGYIDTIVSFPPSGFDGDEFGIGVYQKPIVEFSILTDTGKQVPGADIGITSQSNGYFAARFESDERGNARIELPMTGDYGIAVSHPQFAESAREIVSVTCNPNWRSIQLSTRAGVVYGTVVNGDGEPIQQARIMLYRHSKVNMVASAVTDASGQYRIDAALDDYTAGVDAGSAYLKHDIVFDENRNKTNTLLRPVSLTPEDSIKQVDFQIDSALVIRGTVVDENNRPVQGCRVVPGLQAPGRFSARPIFEEAFTSPNGEFSINLSTRIEKWKTIVLSAAHPTEGMKTHTIAPFDWLKPPDPVTIQLEKSSGTLSAIVEETGTMKPMAGFSLSIIPKHFKNEWTVTTNDNGRFEIDLPVGLYDIKAEGYTVVLPHVISIEPEQTLNSTIDIQKEEQNQIVLKGIILGADQAPVHGALVSVRNNKRFFQQTTSSSDGNFQLNVDQEVLADDAQLTVYHRDFQNAVIPFSVLGDLESIVVLLAEHPGAVKAVLTGVDSCQGMNLYLLSTSRPDPIKYMESVDGNQVWIRKIDPGLGPLFLMASGQTYQGCSAVFQLDRIPSRTVEIEIPLQNREKQSDIQLRILDSKSGEPIPVVTCEMEGFVMDSLGRPNRVKKQAISNLNGIATFKNFPIVVGKIAFLHIYYKKKEIAFNSRELESGVPLDVFFNLNQPN